MARAKRAQRKEGYKKCIGYAIVVAKIRLLILIMR
jgi:hypothetical protein